MFLASCIVAQGPIQPPYVLVPRTGAPLQEVFGYSILQCIRGTPVFDVLDLARKTVSQIGENFAETLAM